MSCGQFCRKVCSCSSCCLEWESDIEKKEDALYFEDKVRKIDYVLVYKVSDEQNEEEDKKKETREIYQANLKKNGVEMEIESEATSQDGKTCFIKLHVPWPILIKYAERMKVKMPLKVEKNENEEPDDELCDCSWFTKTKEKLLEPFKLHNELIDEKFGDQDYYTAEFTRNKIQYFDIKDKNTFFSNAERSRICHRIMDETQFGNNRKDVGISRLLLDGAYVAAFPLHDGNCEKKIGKTENMRQLLYQEWARWRKFYKFQPLDAIRYYLGDKIGIYFAWLGFYTQMLWIPTIVGIICILYSAGTLWNYAPVLEICDDTYPTYAGNLTMCPLCNSDCDFWKLNSSCDASKITYLFDNESTIFFAIFMSLWATMFLEFWKRHQFELSYRWDLVNYDEERDLVRPEYEALVERERYNPATGRVETVMDPKDQATRTGFSVVTVVFWVCVIIAAVFSIIVYRVAMHGVFAASVNSTNLGVVSEVASPSILTTITGSLISLLVIMILNKVYERVAIWLTNLEIPRTRVEWEDSYTFKIFYFQFVNFYSYLFYIAFFKSTFVGRPGKYTYIFDKWRWKGCGTGGCMYELTIQLLIIMLGKQVWNNILELLLPWAMNKYRQHKSEKVAREEDNVYTRWEKDFDLAPLKLDLFYEYLEMVIQFGFVTLFVCAFPLAPLLALLNNIVEIRLDAIKFICEFRRPLALKCSDIGAWYYLLEFLGTLAVVTNAFTIAVTSEAIPKLVYYYQYSPIVYGRNTYEGYVNDSLSVFNVANFSQRSVPRNSAGVTQCRYSDYRYPPSSPNAYALTLQYWHVIAAKLAFVIVMEHLVFFLKKLLDDLIPDRPKKLNSQIKREYYLVQNMLLEAEKEEIIKEHRKNSQPASGEPVEEDQPITEEPVEKDQPITEEPVEKDQPITEEPSEEDEPITEKAAEEDEPITEEPRTQVSNGGGLAYENEMRTTPM